MPQLLKSLELQGYKTFASRTVFEFSGRVTAIVGPNGSGKSNIADSIRWVLGEQSYSLLRGKKTEDMIFAGSEQRPRAGMASATVMFDNRDNWLPIDFAEVAVTRRAYRDGQNEYLVNGQRVRLRDVSELLAQSGLAERTYTIIGQGVVDAALALKAEERRRLFEEAAGIGLHRARREEALRRLDTTRRNLDRVQDILAEIKPRLRYLERQARRAQEYDQVKTDLQAQLREWYGYHWHHAQGEYRAAREAARQQEKVLVKARQEQERLDKELDVLRASIHALRGRLNAWHRQLAELHIRREAISRQRAVAEERRRLQQSQAQTLASEQSRLQEQSELDRERQEAARQEVEGLKTELQESQRQLTLAQQAYTERQQVRQQAGQALQDARQELAACQGRSSAARARLAERQAQAERQRQALDAAILAAAAAEKAVLVAQENAHQAESQRQQAAKALQEANAARDDHQKQSEGLEDELRRTQEERAKHTAELARLRAELQVLVEAEVALTGYTRGAQILLQAARQAKVPGARGALASFLQVPDELETAIAAALGEYLDALVLDEQDGADQALQLLAGDGARGVLLPLKSLVPESPPATALRDVKNQPGVLGIAASLVSSTAELRPAVDLLLGGAIIVRDREAARRSLASLWGERKGAVPHDLRAVTLNGEVYYARGPITAGGEAKPAAISRPRQRTALQASLEQITSRLASLEARQSELVARLDEHRQSGQALDATLAQTRQADDQALHLHAQAVAGAEQAQRQARWQATQSERLQAELDAGAQEAARLTGEIAQLEAEIDVAQQHVRQHSQAQAELPLEELQAQVSHWSTQVAVAERALTEGRSRLEERQLLAGRASAALENAQARLAELHQAQADLDQQKETQRTEESEVAAQIEELQALIEPAEAELQAAETQEEALLSSDSTSHNALRKAEDYHAQARINQARHREALDGWRRRIEDDFGLVSFEYEADVSGPTPLPITGMVEQLPVVRELPPGLDENVTRLRAQLRRMGAINPEAQTEYDEVRQRYEFMTAQLDDLESAEVDIRKVIAELDELMERELRRTFDAVAEEFGAIFRRLFGGGSAKLALTDPDDMANTGIDIVARLPGRRMQGLSLLSGGERSLTATALVFALLKISPTPFCLLDEVDAMLDEANVGRFRELLRELSEATQFIIVTHNRNTVQVADVIYGVTMGRDSASQVLSLKLDQVEEAIKEA